MVFIPALNIIAFAFTWKTSIATAKKSIRHLTLISFVFLNALMNNNANAAYKINVPTMPPNHKSFT